MKYFISLILIVLLFTSCAKREEQVIVYSNNKTITTQEKVSQIKKELPIINQKEVSKHNKLALVYGIQNVGKYALESINVISTYLSKMKSDYIFKVYDIGKQNSNNYKKVMEELKDDNISKAIFLVTENEIDSLFNINTDIEIYCPIIHKDSIKYKVKKNFTFGAINYNEQFKTFIDLQNDSSNYYEIYDNKTISKILHNKLSTISNKYTSIKISGKNPNYSKIFSRHRDLNNSTVILNTSIIKSSIILSQLRANEIIPSEVYSTQINYTPLIFVLTQNEDRRGLKIANSIQKLPKDIDNIFNLMGVDIRYNWVNYSTLIGLEYLFTQSNNIFGNKIKNNQVYYKILLQKIGRNDFKQIDIAEFD